MKEELIENLIKDYPALFEKSKIYDFSIGDGWFNIIDTLCGMICSRVDNTISMLLYERKKKILDEHKISELEMQLEKLKEELPYISQIKEKYGSLRFYIDGGTVEHRNYIDFAEQISNKTCEQCGAPGEPRNSGWIKVLCDTHDNERNQRFKNSNEVLDGS